MACSDSKSGCYCEYINYGGSRQKPGLLQIFYTLLLDGVWEILLPSLGRSVHFGACLPLDLISANIWSDFCTQEVSEKKKPVQKLVRMCIWQMICSSSKCFQHFKVFTETFSSGVNLPCAAPPGLCSLNETGLHCPHSEGRSWQWSALPSASWQVFPWNRSDLLIYPWHPT